MNGWYRDRISRGCWGRVLVFVVVLMTSLPVAAATKSSALAIKARTIIPVTAPPIENGIVLIRDGKIEAVGKDITIPADANIVEAADKVVIPGLIDALTTLAENEQEDEESAAPDNRALDAFDFYKDYRRMLAGGVTTVYVSPGRKRLIGGYGAVVKLAGDSLAERSVKDAAALRITLGEWSKNPPAIFKPPIPPGPNAPILPVEKQLPTTRMAEMAELRRVLTAAQDYQRQRSPKVDPKAEALLPVLKGELPVRVNCHTVPDILNAIRLAEEFHLRLVLEGTTEAYKLVEEIKQSGAPVVVSDAIPPGRGRTTDYVEDIALGRVNPRNAALLAKADIRLALAACDDESIADLLFVAGYAVNQGVPRERALQAVTIAPAEILGVAQRVGSIEPGKDADLVILTGEPFDVQSVVDRTLVNGKTVYTRPAEGDREGEGGESMVAIRAGKIFTASQGQINDGLILLRGSKIAYVGRPGAVPAQAQVIDAGKSVVIPGLIDMHCHLGLHWEGEPVRVDPGLPTTGPNSAALRLVSIANAVEPDDPAFQEARRYGVTSVLLAPATQGLVSGNAAVIKLAGATMQDRVVKEYAAVKFSMRGDTARLASVWEARELLKNAKEYAEKWEQYEDSRREYEHHKAADDKTAAKEPNWPARDANLELLRGLFRHQMPALVHAGRADEIHNALQVFRDEYNLDVVVLGGEDAYRVAEDLKKYNVGVCVGPNVLLYDKGKPISNADLLSRQGLRVAFHTSASSGTQYLLMHAAYAVRHGMDPDKAFRAITSCPAELLHVDDRIGSLEAGKDADLVILSGDFFDLTSRVEMVFINGRVVFEQQE